MLQHMKLDCRENKTLTSQPQENIDNLLIDHSAIPRFFTSKTVSYAVRGSVEDELDRLKNEGIIQKCDSVIMINPVLEYTNTPFLKQKNFPPLQKVCDSKLDKPDCIKYCTIKLIDV